MEGNYKEFEGRNWSSEFVIAQSECNIDLDGDTSEEILDDAIAIMNNTSNNAEICIFPLYIRSDRTNSCWMNNGVDIVKITRDKAISILNAKIISDAKTTQLILFGEIDPGLIALEKRTV